MHAAPEGGPDEDPERTGQVAELRGKHGSDQWPRPCDGGEVVTENNPFGRGNEVLAIAASDCRRSAGVVDGEHLGHQPGRVESISYRKRANPGDDKPERVDRFIPLKGCDGHGSGAEKGDGEPEENADEARHGGDLLK